MPRLAANLTMLYNEYNFLDRFGAAAKSGFKGVEYLFPYDFEAADIVERLQQHGLHQVLHNLPAGDWANGERGIACLPDRKNEFQDGVGRAIEYAQALSCGQLNCLVGIQPESQDADLVYKTVVDNLRFAADELKKAGIRLLSEPVNTRDIPGFFLNGTQQALDLFDDVGSDNLFLQYDIYHMQIMEGDLAPSIKSNLARISHI